MNTFVFVSVLKFLRRHSATQRFGESMLEDFVFAPDEVQLPSGSLIGGVMIPGDGEPFGVVRPSDRRVPRTERSASADGVDLAVQLARSSHRSGVRYSFDACLKGAVIAMTRAVAREAGKDGICVNCAALGLTLSEGLVNNRFYPEAAIQNTVNSRCLVRDQLPDDLTGTVAFLLSAASDFMTGQTLIVDGGSVMN